MADDIPFTPAPRYEQQNPLQNIAAMQGLAQREQAMEQQAITFRAKQALGQIMQKHIDPATGEFDHVNAYGEMASHPELAIIMPDVTEQFLRMPGIKAEALQKVTDYHKNRLELDSGLFADALAKLQMPNADARSIAIDLNTKRQNAGTISKEDALVQAPQLIKLAENKNNFQRAIFQGAQFGQQAQAMNEKNRLHLGYLTEEVDVPDNRPQLPDGSPNPNYGAMVKMPRYQAGGLTAGQAAIMGGQGQVNAEPGGLAPPAPGEARQERSPSVSPAARLTAAPIQSKQYRDYMEDTEGTKHWLRKEEISAQDEANKAMEIETNLHRQEEQLRQFGQGPLMEARVRIAEYMRGLNFPESMVKSFVQEAEGAKDGLAAAQLARKYFFEGAANELKTALPGLQKATNFDVQTALKASPEMGMSKEAINSFMKNFQNILDMSKERANWVERYATLSKNDPAYEGAFNQNAYNRLLRDILQHKKLLKTGPLNVTKKPGEK